MNQHCPICNSPLANSSSIVGDISPYSCSLCGDYVLSGTLVYTLQDYFDKDKDAEFKIKHFLAKRRKEKSVTLNTYVVEKILEQSLPRPREHADLLIRWIGENIPGPGETFWVEPRTHMGIIGAKTPAGFEMVILYLFETGLVTGILSETLDSQGEGNVTLSFKGWEHYENLREGAGKYRKAFMAMKFNDSQLDSVFKDVFKPFAKQAGFDLFALNEIHYTGLVDDRIRVEIQASDFLVSDLTHENPGAYWEAGYAEGLGKPVIYTCEKQKFELQATHFDTNHHLTVLWDDADLSKAGEQLKATIRATLPHLAKMND